MGKESHPDYPEEWEAAYALPCKEAAGWRCERCGVVDGSLATTQNGRRRGRPHIVYLNAAHRDRDKRNPTPSLAALCPTCHGLYDRGTSEDRTKVLRAVQETRRKTRRTPW